MELGSDIIGFNGLAAGTIVSAMYGDGGLGPVYISGANKRLPGMNAAVIYDSACEGGCTGKGADLGTPNESFGGPGIGADGREGALYQNDTAQGGVLIVARDLDDVDPADGLVDEPVDQGNRREVSFSFDFTELMPVTVLGLAVLDSDQSEEAPSVEMFDAAGGSLATVVLPVTGDNGVAHVDLEPVDGVATMVVTLRGSGAIDDIRFASAQCIGPETEQ